MPWKNLTCLDDPPPERPSWAVIEDFLEKFFVVADCGFFALQSEKNSVFRSRKKTPKNYQRHTKKHQNESMDKKWQRSDPQRFQTTPKDKKMPSGWNFHAALWKNYQNFQQKREKS